MGELEHIRPILFRTLKQLFESWEPVRSDQGEEGITEIEAICEKNTVEANKA